MIKIFLTGLAHIQMAELKDRGVPIIEGDDDEKYGISEHTIKLLTQEYMDPSEYHDLEPKPSKNKFKFKSPNWNF